MAERSSVSDSAWLKPASGRFQVSSAAVPTASAEGVQPVSLAAQHAGKGHQEEGRRGGQLGDLRRERSDWRLRKTARTPTSASAANV